MNRGFAIKIQSGLVRMVVAILLLILLSQVLASDRAPVPLRPRNVPVPEAQKEHIAKGLAASYGLGPFQPSLEMKENADFLLTHYHRIRGRYER